MVQTNGQAVDLDELVAVKRRLDASSAQLLKGVLESYGVPAYIVGENMGLTLAGAASTDLLVRQGDKERAEAMINNVAALPGAARPRMQVGSGEIPDLACEHCGSMHIRPYAGPVPTWIPGVRRDVPPEDGWYQCDNCKSYFRDGPTRFQSLPTGFLWAVLLAGATFALIWLINWIRWVS